jgi:hypothetical protein
MGEGHFVEYFFVKNQKVDQNVTIHHLVESDLFVESLTSTAIKVKHYLWRFFPERQRQFLTFDQVFNEVIHFRQSD